MAVPKKKTSKSRRDMRRSHHTLSQQAFGKCRLCNEWRRLHHGCDQCGVKRDALKLRRVQKG